MKHRHCLLKHLGIPMLIALVCSLALFSSQSAVSRADNTTDAGILANAPFSQAAHDFGVPEALLKGLCYMEGRLSNHGGSPSIDNGFGCMHLIKNQHGDTLDQAASELHVSVDLLRNDLATNIRGGAAVLRDEALKLSSSHTLPTNLADWYGAVAAYSQASTSANAIMYADALYKLLNTGYSAPTEHGEAVTLAPQRVSPNRATAAQVKAASTLPAGCTIDNKVDYPNAVDCLLDPNIFDCTLRRATYPPCNYEERTHAGYSLPVTYVVIHDTEGSLQDALNVFQNPDPKTSHGSSANYIVDSDGTVYQVVHDADFTYNVGNYWYNQHSIGIEHVGFDATGFLWYNAAQYLGSAKLTAYLLKKFNIPLDRNHVVAHGTVPSTSVAATPNHVDPGPYWLWDYYLNLVHEQGVIWPREHKESHIITLRPQTDRHPFNKNGTETPANFNFFYLYNGPSTASGLIPQLGNSTDITDETNNVEADISYSYLAKVKDPAGSGDTLYEIWYGVYDQAHANPPSKFMDAQLVWLAVPADTAEEGPGIVVSLSGPNRTPAQIYGRSPAPGYDVAPIGQTPANSLYASGYTVVQDNTTNTLWYEINFTHRQAWVPASEVTIVQAT